MPEYGVESCHINVGAGDSAIHLQVQHDGTKPDGSGVDASKPYVLAAVLIDGGHNRRAAPDNVRRAFTEILGHYDFARTNGQLKFDSVIITHWDEDHHLGLTAKILAGDIEDQLGRGVAKADVQISFFRYADNTGMANPQTTLYCPNWDGIKEGDKWILGGAFCKLRQSTDKDGSCYVDYLPKSTKTFINQGPRYTRLLKLNSDPSSILGTEMFSGRVLPSTSPASGITSPALLVAAHKPTLPGIYCVSAGDLILGGSADLHAIEHMYRPRGIVGLVDKAESWTNRLSIACFVIFADGRLSHYFAGDKEEALEKRIVEWSGLQGTSASHIPSIKASHHGSVTSFPQAMIEKWKPNNVIMSAGSDHGHPRWELLYYLDAYSTLRFIEDGEAGLWGNELKLWSTSYPYWFVQDKNGQWWQPTRTGDIGTEESPTIGINYFDDPASQFLVPYADIWARLKAKSPTYFAAEDDNPLNSYKAAFPDRRVGGWKPRYQWIVNYIQPRWSLLAPSIIPEYVPKMSGNGVRNGTYIGTRRASDLEVAQIYWIRVSCRSDLTIDGAVQIVSDRRTLTDQIDEEDASEPAAKFARYDSTAEAVGLVASDSIFIDTSDSTEISDKMQEDENEDEPGLTDASVETGMQTELTMRQKALVSVPRQADVTIVVPSDGYYYCSDRRKQASGVVNASNIPFTSALGKFLTPLHMGWVKLQVTPPDSLAWNAIDASDDWFTWFRNSNSCTSLSCYSDKTTIKAIEATTTFASLGLYFSTLSTPAQFKLDSASPQLLYDPSMIVLGLAVKRDMPKGSSTVLSTKLSAILAEVKLPLLAFAAGASSLDPNLTIDLLKANARNAIWFLPGKDYTTVMRLDFDIDPGSKASLNTGLLEKVGMSLLDGSVIVRRKATWRYAQPKPRIRRSTTLVLHLQIHLSTDPPGGSSLGSLVQYDNDSRGICLTLLCDATDGISRYISWLTDLLKNALGISFNDFTQALRADWLPKPRRIRLSLSSSMKPTSFGVDFEVTSPFGSGKPVAFLFTYNWSAGGRNELTASVWPTAPAYSGGVPIQLLPDDEEYAEFQPVTPGALARASISDLVPGGIKSDSWPKGIPQDIAGLNLTLTRQTIGSTTQTKIEFYGCMVADYPEASVVPTIYIGSVGLNLAYTFNSGEFDLALEMSVVLSAPPSTNLLPAVLTGDITYHSKGITGSGTPSWQIIASVQHLNVAHLTQFFHVDSQDVVSLVSHFAIEELYLTYDYNSSGEGSHFLFDGLLLLGSAQLHLTFEHFPDSWSFDATLSAPAVQETIGSLVSAMGSSISLPSFVSSINLLSNASFSLHIRRKTIKNVAYSVFQADIVIDVFEVTFIRYTTASWSGAKEVFRASVGKLPDVGVPVIDKLTQPFDEMYFVNVLDNSGLDLRGVQREELEILNEQVRDPFSFKEVVTSSNQKMTDIIISNGLHFVLMLTEQGVPKVVLDHAFSAAPGSTPGWHNALFKDTGDPPSSSNVSKAAITKTIGALSISNLGLQYKDGHLLVLLDATVKLGPIELDLLGFGLDLDFSTPGKYSIMGTKELPPIKPNLNGLGFGFSNPPVTAEGMFLMQGDDFFVGGVTIGFEPYLFVAGGCYGVINNTFKTVALFCKLEGPLVEFEFGEISAICGGFGYNSMLKFPTIDQVSYFPFVAQDAIGSSPLDTIKLMGPGGWVTPKNGSIWLAAGLTVDAFKMLSVNAVVAVDFDTSVKLAIFADATAAFPPPPAPVHYVFVELQIAAIMDFGAGSLLIEAQLAPTSYIYAGACHLTGGCALGFWFGPSSHAGDWVFTLGGYHPAFKAPSHYPNPPRLQICWSLDSALSITGQAYFALTPKVCMGGGCLKAALSIDPLYAWFDAWADFLIKFQPFYFIGDAGVDVGVQFTLDLWICTIHISIDINATLHLEGPPVHGFVHVDFWVFGFDIHFGTSLPKPDPVNLLGFYQLLAQQAAAKASLASSSTVVAHSSEAETRLIAAADPNEDTITDSQTLTAVAGVSAPTNQSQVIPAHTPWQVRAGTFQFTVASVFAIGSASVNLGDSVHDTVDIHSRPMEIQGTMTSTMTICIYQIENKETKPDPHFRAQANISNVPKSMWGTYDEKEDPLSSKSGGNQTGTLLDGKTDTMVQHIMSVTLTAPPAHHSVDKIPAFDAAAAMSSIVASPTLAAMGSSDPAWVAQSPQPADAWTTVPQTWKAPKCGAGAQNVAMRTWAKAMGWKDWSAEVKGVPSKLVNEFEDYFLACPGISVGTG